MPGNTKQEDDALREKLRPTLGGIRLELPAPTASPDERKRQRLAFRNERKLYHSTCALTGKPIITLYSPDKELTVYSKEAWWGDGWDPLSYGRSFDFTRPFFEQLAELSKQVPRIALVSSPDADENNCQYMNYAGNSRNCYMVFDSDFNEDSAYANVLKHSTYCMDCSYVNRSELCYECVDCSACYNLNFSQDCMNCSDGYFLFQCTGCFDCAFCYNLSNKRYHIFNKAYSRDEYLKILTSYELENRASLNKHIDAYQKIVQQAPKKYCHILQAENCVGDYIINAKNCYHSFNIADGEDLRYCDSLYGAKDCMDVSSFGERIERVYQSGTIGINCHSIYFSVACVQNCHDLFYCIECRQGKNSFGSVGLKRHEYCILNTPYMRAEYEKLALRIYEHMRETGEWGMFLPVSLSPVGYNETIAQEFFPLDEDSALQRGFSWSSYEAPAPKVKTIGGQDLPLSIDLVSDEILNSAIASAKSGKAYRLTRSEVEFLRRKNLPVPALHPDERHMERMAKRNPPKLWDRQCAKTGKPVISSYAPERNDTVLCEEAYLEALT